MNAPPKIDAIEVFIRDARAIAFRSADHGSYALYERLKGLAAARLPGIDSAQYERVVRELARVSGV